MAVATKGRESSVLWFTSTQSWKLQAGGGPSFNGLYMCDNLSPETGTCDDPKLIVDTVDLPASDGVGMEHGLMHHTQHDHHPHHRGIDLMNVQIDESSNTLFTGYFDKNRNSFEILSAPLVAPVSLRSFFRTGIFSSNNGCKMACCEEATHTYFKVQPRDFVVDKNEVFISWDAFYQDCGNIYTKKSGLKWTVGVSKLLQTEECLHTKEEVSFAECTEPVAIAFQDSKQREKLLGYAGFAIGNMHDSDKRLFFLSALHRVDLKILNNELWVLREGFMNPYPDVQQVESVARINSRFADIAVDDVGTIRLRKDGKGVPTGLCRTAYDAAIVCHQIKVQPDGQVNFTSANTFVTKDVVSESCAVVKSDHYPASKLINSVATGMEVHWSDGTPDDNPDFVVFGCYGEINFSGNITTAFRDGGRVVQTIAGAYPGSILKGVDVHREQHVDLDSSSLEAPNHDKVSGMKTYHNVSTQVSSSSGIGHVGFVLTSIILIAAAAVIVFKRKRISSWRDTIVAYDPVTQLEDGGYSNTSYVELAGTSYSL
jgi:hypothetical protein